MAPKPAAETTHRASPRRSARTRSLGDEAGHARLGALIEARAARRPGAVGPGAAGTPPGGGAGRSYFTVDPVADFRRRHPGVGIRLVGQTSAEVVELIHDGELEAGAVALPIDDRGLEVFPVLHDELVYVSADRARLEGPVTI